MTLAEMIEAHPALFYLNNRDWFKDEPFMHVPATDGAVNQGFTVSEVDGPGPREVRAVDLALLYVRDPGYSVWRKFLWTDDIDRWGNRVYVAGIGQHGIETFQIHRHLQPAAWWVRTV